MQEDRGTAGIQDPRWITEPTGEITRADIKGNFFSMRTGDFSEVAAFGNSYFVQTMGWQGEGSGAIDGHGNAAVEAVHDVNLAMAADVVITENEEADNDRGNDSEGGKAVFGEGGAAIGVVSADEVAPIEIFLRERRLLSANGFLGFSDFLAERWMLRGVR